MSQLTLIAIFLLVIAMWKFGPWFRKRRILSYEFPIGWWNHVAIIVPNYQQWSHARKSRLMDYVRLFVDRIDFTPAPSMAEELEIKHRVAIATQAFLLFEYQRGDPLRHIERFYLQRSSHETSASSGLPKLFWEERDLNFITLFEVSSLGGSLQPYELGQLANFLKDELNTDPEAGKNIKSVLGSL